MKVDEQIKKLIVFVVLPILIGGYIIGRILLGNMSNTIYQYVNFSEWDYGIYSVMTYYSDVQEKHIWLYRWHSEYETYRDTTLGDFCSKFDIFFIENDSNSTIIDWRGRAYESMDDFREKITFIEFLNFLGALGWELVNYEREEDHGTYIFKRRWIGKKYTDILLQKYLDAYFERELADF